MNVERDQHASPPSLLTKTIPIIYLSDPSDLMQRLQEVGRKFFELQASEKESVTRPVDSQDMEGYFTEDPKHLKAWDDHLIQSIWPPSSTNYKYYIGLTILQIREVTEECTRNVTKLTEKIVCYSSKGLGLRREALQECLGGDKAKYVMRINYYPPSDSVIGAPAHTDACGLALLISNERMRGTRINLLHRSIMDKEKTRMTWPVLVEPKHSLVVGHLPELTGEENPPKFESLTFQVYIYRKIKKLRRD